MSVQGRRFDIQHHKSGEENKFLIPLHNVMLIICLEENIWVYVTKSILHVLCMPLTWSLNENGTAHTLVAQDGDTSELLHKGSRWTPRGWA